MIEERVLASRLGIGVGDWGPQMVGFLGANFVVGTLVSWALGWGIALPHGIVLLAIGASLMTLGARFLMWGTVSDRGMAFGNRYSGTEANPDRR